jgi:hypothetical protein
MGTSCKIVILRATAIGALFIAADSIETSRRDTPAVKRGGAGEAIGRLGSLLSV